MTYQEILMRAEEFVYELLSNDVSGHDYFHVKRVVNLAEYLQGKEGGNSFVIIMAAWLHDVDDYKLKKKSIANLELFWSENEIDELSKNAIMNIIDNISFHKSFANPTLTLEAKIVQDADRLDAMGAIGIARTFAFGGSKGNIIFHPNIKPISIDSERTYKNAKSTTINHFYEKLLLLKDKLNTQTAKEIGEERHKVMLHFLEQFHKEWDFEQ